jgi:predicted nucleic acid-binding protein
MTLVVDASILAEVLIGSSSGWQAAQILDEHRFDLHIPHHAAIEAASVLRRWTLRGDLGADRAAGAVEDLASFPARRWPVEPFLPDIWQLRDRITPYDAAYVSLAAFLDAPLVTLDRRLAKTVTQSGLCRLLAVRDQR